MDRFQSRRDKLRESWKDFEVEALLVSATSNVYYLTGFSGDSSALLVAHDRDVIISDGRFTTQLAQECPALEAVIRSPGEEMNPAVARVLKALGLTRLGFEAAHLSVADHLALSESAPGVQLRGLNGQVETLRQIKDDDEIAALREAVRFAEHAFNLLAKVCVRAKPRKRRLMRRGASPPERGNCGQLPANRGGGGQFRKASRTADVDHPDWRRRLRPDRLGCDWPSL